MGKYGQGGVTPPPQVFRQTPNLVHLQSMPDLTDQLGPSQLFVKLGNSLIYMK